MASAEAPAARRVKIVVWIPRVMGARCGVKHGFRAVLSTGVRSLLLHKLRSILTTLGVLFGVASVVAMLAIGEGASSEAQEQIKKLGSQNVILRSVKPPENLASNESTRISAYGLTDLDLLRVGESFPGVRRAVPVRR